VNRSSVVVGNHCYTQYQIIENKLIQVKNNEPHSVILTRKRDSELGLLSLLTSYIFNDSPHAFI